MPVEVYTKGGITYQKNTYTGEVKRLKQSIRTTEQEKKDVSSSKSSKSQSDYVNYYERQKSIDPNMISSENKITRVKDDSGRTIGVSDPVARKSFGFSQPLTAQQEKDVLIAESRRQVQTQAPQQEIVNKAGTPGMVRAAEQNKPLSLKGVANLRGRKFDNEIVGAGANLAAGFATSIYTTKEFAVNLFTQPRQVVSNLGATGKSFFKGEFSVPEVGLALRNEPEFATGFIGGELLTGYGGVEVVKFSSKAIRTGITVLDPKFIRASDKTISNIPSTKKGVDIELAGGAKSTSEPLIRQVSLAGDDVLGVSAQRNLFSRRTKEILVDKPLPTPDSPPLEKAFFADPRGRLRQSRLGSGFKEDVPTPKDDFLGSGLTEDIVFSREKPQALFFEDAKVSSFPDNLKVVEYKLRIGKSLSAAEKKALIEWQLTPTGEFKTPGFLSTESEIVLSPGEVIEKVSKRGVTLLRPKGKLFPKRVSIFEARVRSGGVTADIPSATIPLSSSTKTLSSSLKPVRRVSLSELSGRVIGSAPSSSSIPQPTTASLPRSGEVLTGSVSYKMASAPLSFSYSPRLSPSSSVNIPSRSPISVSPSIVSGSSGSRGRSGSRSIGESSSVTSASTTASSSTKSASEIISSIARPTSGASGFSTSPSRPTTFLKTPFPTFKKPRERPRDFSVQVRKQGKFVTIGRGLSKQSAITRGRTVIGSSPLASFKILQGRTALNINKLGLRGRGFFQSKKGSGVIVEKTKFRISSIGEKIGIPGKAKRKRKQEKLFEGIL